MGVQEYTSREGNKSVSGEYTPEYPEFWVDWEGGDPRRARYVVEVFGDFSDFPLLQYSPTHRGDKPPPPSDPDILKVVLRDKVVLWSKDYVVMLYSQFYVRLLNRGLRYRLWRDKLRVKAVSRFIAKHARVVDGHSNVVFLTLTYDPSKYDLASAWRDIRRRVSKTIRFYKRHYGVKVALATVEVHESLYPHIHMVILLDSPAPTFWHRNTLRFQEKRDWDRTLAREGFTDAQSPKNAKEISRYLSKYLAKVERELGGGAACLMDRPKALAPFLCRLFRIPLVRVYPRGFDKKLLGLTKPTEPVKRIREEVLLAEAIWSLIYRRPIESVPFGTLDYWHKVQRYIATLYARYHEKMTGRPPEKRAYDLINISSFQSPPDWAFWAWVMSLLYSYFEASRSVVVLGYCSISLGS